MHKTSRLLQTGSVGDEYPTPTIVHVCCGCNPHHLVTTDNRPLLDDDGNRVLADPDHLSKGITYSHGVCREAMKILYPSAWEELYGSDE